MTKTALAANQYIDRNGNVRTRAIRHSLAAEAAKRICTCPSDCNCRSEFRTTFCGCKAH